MAPPNIIPDVTEDFSGGQNAGVNPHAINPNQYYIGVNISSQSTSLKPRWGIEEIPLDFSETGSYRRQTGFDVSFERVFKTGKFQAFLPYLVGVDNYVLYIVSGFIFAIELFTRKVIVLNPTDPVNVHADRINWSDAGSYTVVFDWPNYPFILDGLTARRADPALYEVPVSVLGAYNENRLCIANAGLDWTAGDPAGNTATPDAPITFFEVLLTGSPYLANVYQIPTASKLARKITAMGFLQVIDTSTGIGPLIVSTANALYSYRTDLPRAQWQGGANDFVFGSMLLPSTGIVGQRAHTNVGGDILFLGRDGQVYALSMARNDQRRWGNSPISREVKNFLTYNDTTIIEIGVAEYFKNMLFVTSNPYRVNCISAEGLPQYDYVNRGMVVMEMDVNSGLTKETPPIWTGLWTGIPFMDMAEVGDVLYIAGKRLGRNGLFKFNPDTTYDVYDGKVTTVRCVLETREYTNQDDTINKELHSMDLGLRELEGTFTLKAEYKPSTLCNYIPWQEYEFTAPVEQCGFIPEFLNGACRQGILDFTIGSPKVECIPGTNDLTNVYKAVQIRLILEAKHWQLEYIRVKGRVIPRNELITECSDVPEAYVPRTCFDYWEIKDE